MTIKIPKPIIKLLYIYFVLDFICIATQNDFRNLIDKKFDVSSYLIICYTRAVGKREGEGGNRKRQNFYMWRTYTRLEFIYWTRHKWQKVDSFFWLCHFSSKLSYHSYHQGVCESKFLIRTYNTYIKTYSNLICGSF